jgi:hypothetical protein
LRKTPLLAYLVGDGRSACSYADALGKSNRRLRDLHHKKNWTDNRLTNTLNLRKALAHSQCWCLGIAPRHRRKTPRHDGFDPMKGSVQNVFFPFPFGSFAI